MFEFRSLYLDDPPVAGRILDLFDATPTTKNTGLFFVHGGSWIGGSRTIFHSIMRACQARGFDCASTDYRLGGTRVFEQIADVQESLRRFAEDLQKRGHSPNIVLIGSSAGAHLALMAALLPSAIMPAYRVAAICVQAAPFTFEPWPDIFPAIWTSMRDVVGYSFEERPDLYAHASPINHINSNTPPVFSLHAENEHMFPLELTESFSAKASECGVIFKSKIYPKTEHGFFYSLDRWQQKEALQDILRFVEEVASPSQR